MINEDKIYEFVKNTAYPKTEKIYREEMLAYMFVTQFVQNNAEIILPKLRKIMQMVVKVSNDYFQQHMGEQNQNIIDVAVATVLTCEKCHNTGAIDSNWGTIEQTMREGNVRELFFVFDEFVHNGCYIGSWLLYCHPIDFIVTTYDLSRQNVILKLKYVAEVIAGSKQSLFDEDDKLELFIKTYLGTKYDKYRGKGKEYTDVYPWEVGEFPSYCNLWNMQERTYFSHKLLFLIEYQRNIEFTKQKTPFGFQLGDASVFDQPPICNARSANFSFKVDEIQLPPISSREYNYYKKTNRDIADNKIILWKSGCCSSYVKDETVTYKLAADMSKPRVTSYSGHVITDLELLSLFDVEFELWKEIYMICVMATMIPYCHHSAHEIFSVCTYWNIPYDIEQDYFVNFKRVLEMSKNPICNAAVGLLISVNGTVDNYFKGKSRASGKYTFVKKEGE